jgi:hypothetical protein
MRLIAHFFTAILPVTDTAIYYTTAHFYIRKHPPLLTQLLSTTTCSTFVAAIAGLYWPALHAVVSVKSRYASLQL